MNRNDQGPIEWAIDRAADLLVDCLEWLLDNVLDTAVQFTTMFVLPVLLVVLLFGGAGAVVYSLTSPRTCASQGTLLELPHQWDFWAGCYVTLDDGTRLPVEEVIRQRGNEYRVEMK